MPSTTNSIASATIPASRNERKSTPAHGQKRPRTSARERASAARPRRFSPRSTGIATDQATAR